MSEKDLSLPYSFNDEERKIAITRYDLPSPWINYLSNGKMHAFVSQAGGGMAWWLTPQNFRITRYRFYNLPIDSPGFYIYIKTEDGSIWSPTFRPCDTPLDFFEATHAPGYTYFTAEKNGLKAILTLFMAADFNALIWNLKLKNESGKDIKAEVFAYTELSEFAFLNEVNLDYYLKWQVKAEYDEDIKSVLYTFNSFVQIRKDEVPMVYFSTDSDVASFCCSRDAFCGNYRDERNPIAVEKGNLGNVNLNGGEPCAALHSHILLLANEEKEINYFLGVTGGAFKDYNGAYNKTKATLTALKASGAVKAQLEKNKEWWKNHLEILQCVIPDKTAERMINTWNPVQSVVTARFSRSISSSASGIRGIGFRDTAQDMLAQAYRKPQKATDMLCYLASQQFADGSTVHQSWPEDNKLPQVATRSDNHIWMSYLAYAIVAETGDYSALDKKVPFLSKDLKSADGEGTIWQHLMRGVEFTENNKGEHGLPLILFSDWNDHLGPFGRRGKGESVFVSQQHVYQLRLLTEIAEARGDKDTADYLKRIKKAQEDALKIYCWNGKWYLRGFDDDGNPIGTASATNAKIWVNTQSWNVIAGCGDRAKDITAMNSVKEYLDTGLGLLINKPGLPDSMVNGLPKGYSENGGVFCQANCWAIIAEALLGRGNVAWKYYKQIMPDEVIKKIGIENYKNEAYAYSSTMLGPENKQFGQACVSQVTGTAAWMDVAATQYLLGIRPEIKGLLISPSIPSDWKGFKVKRKYRGHSLTIVVNNPHGKEHGVKAICVNGEEVDVSCGAYITEDVLGDKDEIFVDVLMG